MTADAPPVVHTIEARVHGRVLVLPPSSPPPWPVLVGFHGYAENADTHLRAISAIPGADGWLIAAVEALHPFYTRQQRIVASWMTSQDRELAIADNVDYVGRVLEWLRTRHVGRVPSDVGRIPSEVGRIPSEVGRVLSDPAHALQPLVFAGFSQGGAMAYRAAAQYACSGLLILAADVPPDIAQQPNVKLPPVLIGRGTRDQWYTAEKHEADLTVLEPLGVPVESCVFDGGHEWGAEFLVAASSFLRDRKNTKRFSHEGHEGHESST